MGREKLSGGKKERKNSMLNGEMINEHKSRLHETVAGDLQICKIPRPIPTFIKRQSKQLTGGEMPKHNKKHNSPTTISNAPAGLPSTVFSHRGIPQLPSHSSAPQRFGAHGERNRQDPSLQKMGPTEQCEKSSASCCSTA